MEVNRLLGDEIEYELAIRQLPVGNTVANNRVTLRGALRCEREGLSFPPTVVHLEPARELEICYGKLMVLRTDIQQFDQSNKDNEYKRITSRLYHINARLRRLPSGDEQLEEQRKELLGMCAQLLGLIQERVESCKAPRNNLVNFIDQENEDIISLADDPLIPSIVITSPTLVSQSRSHPTSESNMTALPSTSNTGYPVGRTVTFDEPLVTEDREHHPPMNPILRNSHRRHSLGHRFSSSMTNMDQVDLETHLRDLNFSNISEPFPHSNARPYHLDVTKWRLKFDGESSVTNFLERVDELRISRGVSKEQLLKAAPELFTKDALYWYRTQQFSSWDHLETRLKEDFQPYDYELDLLEEIKKRTQGAKERVITYVAAMENLFKKLGSSMPREEDKVKMIRRNLLPYIQTQLSLQATPTISELVRLSRAIEETSHRVQRFCPPPTNYKGLLEPELAYRKPPGSSSSFSSVVAPVESKSKSDRRDTETDQPSVYCWNCKGAGHRFRKCLEPRRKFCFKCGKENMISSQCCQKNLRNREQN